MPRAVVEPHEISSVLRRTGELAAETKAMSRRMAEQDGPLAFLARLRLDAASSCFDSVLENLSDGAESISSITAADEP